MEKTKQLLFCHLVGDYVLQSTYLAETKGKDWYYLFVRCELHCMSFDNSAAACL